MVLSIQIKAKSPTILKELRIAQLSSENERTLTVCNFVTGHFDCEKFKEVNVEQFRTMEENTKSVLCILVGFYVSIQIGRWWSQTSKMPKLNKLAMELNAIMQIGKL